MSTWQRIVVSRGTQALFVALVVGILTFIIMRSLPGDAAFRIAAARYGYDLVDAASAAAVRAELGLDAPWLVALGQWLSQLFVGNFGTSVVSGKPVWNEAMHELGASVTLAAATLGLVALFGIPLGLVSGMRPHGWVDRASFAAATVLRALPPFALGLVLILIFSVQLGALPAAGHGDGRSLILPALTLALPLAATAARVVRESVVGVVSSAYWRFSRSKGLSGSWTLVRHGLRNLAVPMVAWLGVQGVLLVEGVVIVETLFARPGLGHAMVHAIFGRDVPMIQVTALLLGLLFVVFNTLVDAICMLIDPRLRANGNV